MAVVLEKPVTREGPRAGARARAARAAMRLHRTLLLLVACAGAAPAALAVALLLRARRGCSTRATLAAVAGSLVLAAALSRRSSRGASRARSRECVRGALEIARGRFGREVQVGARNELGDLAYTFNHMSRELASYDGENRRLIDGARARLPRHDPEPRRRRSTRRTRTRAATPSASRRSRSRSGASSGSTTDALAALEYGADPPRRRQDRRCRTPILAKRARAHARGDARSSARTRRSAREIVAGRRVPARRAARDPEPPRALGRRRLPGRLAGEAIPLVARIVNAADTWDACTSEPAVPGGARAGATRWPSSPGCGARRSIPPCTTRSSRCSASAARRRRRSRGGPAPRSPLAPALTRGAAVPCLLPPFA